MTRITRRTALARMAAVPATLAVGTASSLEAVAAGNVTANLASTSPDAELIRLGAEFDRLREGWPPVWREMNRLHHVCMDTIRARGLSLDKDLDACIVVENETGSAAACDRNDEYLASLWDLADRIRAMKPTTIAGLRAHASVCRFDCIHMPTLEKPKDDWDLSDRYLHDFLAEIETLAAKGGAS